MFTTEPSRNAMPDPTMVAASVSHLRLCDRAASRQIVAWMTPASQGGRVNPTIGCSRRKFVAGQGAPRIYRLQRWPSKVAASGLVATGISLRQFASSEFAPKRAFALGCPAMPWSEPSREYRTRSLIFLHFRRRLILFVLVRWFPG